MAEPFEILIAPPPQKRKSADPTHQNPPHRGYVKRFERLKPLDFLLEHIMGLQKPVRRVKRDKVMGSKVKLFASPGLN